VGLRGRVVAPEPSYNSRRVVPPKRTTVVLLTESAGDSIRAAAKARVFQDGGTIIPFPLIIIHRHWKA
jgi:hypothetical protein